MKQSPNRSVATRLRTLLLTLSLVLAGVVGVAGSASADTGICSGYTSCSTSGHSNHGYAANSGNMYWTMYSGHNCTNYAAYMAIQNGAPSNITYLHSAGSWAWDVEANSPNTPVNGTPAVGAIAQWDAGHVAYVEAVNSDGSITVSEEDYLGDFHWRVITRSGDWPDNFIHFADVVVNNGEGQLQWKLRNHKSSGAPDASFYYGPDNGKPVVGDWDANGSESIGSVRDNGAGNLFWQLRYSNTDGDPSVTATYGASTDTPIVGNWDGVGTTTVGIVRNDGSGQLLWKLSNDNGTTATTFYYGASTDIPIVGDWDGNGTTTVGIVRKDTASGQLLWKLRNSNSAGTADVSFYYGGITTKPVPGDWDGNGTVTAGVVRNDDGSGQLYWQLRDSNSAGTPGYEFYYGGATDTPVAGSWGGAGSMNVGIVR